MSPASPTSRPGITPRDLAVAIGARLVSDGAGALVRGVRQDSRRVESGELFVALRGGQVDGITFLDTAVERGAVAVLTEPGRAPRDGLAWLEHGDPRRAMAEAASIVYGRPSERAAVVGITGTNGKTTTAHLIQAAIGSAGGRCGIVGTLGNRFEGFEESASHTSPEADSLQRLLAAMVDRGADHVVMEVSSIALAAGRVSATRFDVALFTNLSQDHLDYHGSMEAYASAKRSLFVDHAPRRTVVNLDDPWGRALAFDLPSPIGTSRVDDPAATVALVDERAVEGGRALSIRTPRGVVELTTHLVGRHNVENLLGAIGVVVALDLDVEAAARGLARAPQVPGRLERCDDPSVDDLVAVVDYAHTPDALTRVLASLRPLVGEGRLWCVFGCGGDRDAAKRSPMGAAVASGADVAVVTNDNPRSEDPRVIARAVEAGLVAAGSSSHHVILDRADAIGHAVERAAPGDVVLVAGKGHEPYQILGENTVSFDDREQLRSALRHRREGR